MCMKIEESCLMDSLSPYYHKNVSRLAFEAADTRLKEDGLMPHPYHMNLSYPSHSLQHAEHLKADLDAPQNQERVNMIRKVAW